jgi:cytochrome c-type biogenesis protein CcmH/NrfF
VRSRLVVTAALAALLLAAPATAIAASCPRTSTSDIADEVMCLQCGVPLNLAEDAPSAKRERAYIQQLVNQCRSKEQIKTALVAQFGSNVLADPRSSATWLVPALAFGAAAVALLFGALRWRRRRANPVLDRGQSGVSTDEAPGAPGVSPDEARSADRPRPL